MKKKPLDLEHTEKPHFSGHRDRLRARFLKSGPESLADYEVLELILFMAIPRRDVKPLAKNLINAFGGLPSVMNASLHDLQKIEGISEKTAIALKTVTVLAHRTLKQK